MTPSLMSGGISVRRFALPYAFLLFGMILFAPNGAAAQWLQDGREPPLYPSIITAVYKGRTYPIAAVDAEVAEIRVDGKLLRLPLDQSYLTPRAVGFAPGYVTFKDQSATGQIWTRSVDITGYGQSSGNLVSGGVVSETGKYECTVVSSEDHPDCYLAVIFFRKDASGNPDAATTAMAFRQIGDLAAGRDAKVTINSGYVPPQGTKYYFFPLIYSRGAEIRSDKSDESSRYFRRGEMAAHAALLARYRQQYPAADKAAIPYLRFQPQLPVGVNPVSLPAVVNARFAVTETGEVDALEIDPALDPPVEREIRRALNGWLFMPRLNKGYPVRSAAQVPLSFDLGPH